MVSVPKILMAPLDCYSVPWESAFPHSLDRLLNSSRLTAFSVFNKRPFLARSSGIQEPNWVIGWLISPNKIKLLNNLGQCT